jgi:hypothetical protein
VSITPQCVVGSRKRKDLTPIQLSKRWIPRRKEAVKDAQALLTNETKSSVVTLLDLLEGQRTDALAVQTRLEALIHLEAFLRGDAVAAGIPTITLEAFTEGILPRCIRLLQPTVASQSHVVVLQLLDFCIACSSAIRAIVIHHDALLLAMFALCKPAEVHISVLRAGARTLAALCCCEITPPVFARLQRVMDVLAPLVHSDDDDVIETACLGLAALSQDLTEDNSQIQAVISSGVCKRVAELLLSLNPNVHTAALRLVGNLVTGDTKQTQTVLNSGVMPGVVALMSPEQPFMPTHRAVCWTLSNILAGDDVQIACALRANVVTTLTITLQTKNATEDEQSEAAWALSNAMTGADDSQVRYLKSQGFTPALCGYFNQLNSETKEGDEAAAGGSESKPLVDAPPQAVHVALTGLEFTLREAGAPDLTAYSEWVDSGKGRDVFRDMISMYCAFVRIALPVTTRDVSMEMSTFHSLLAHCRQIFQAAAKHSSEIVAKTAVAALRSCFNETVTVAAA